MDSYVLPSTVLVANIACLILDSGPDIISNARAGKPRSNVSFDAVAFKNSQRYDGEQPFTVSTKSSIRCLDMYLLLS